MYLHESVRVCERSNNLDTSSFHVRTWIGSAGWLLASSPQPPPPPTTTTTTTATRVEWGASRLCRSTSQVHQYGVLCRRRRHSHCMRWLVVTWRDKSEIVVLWCRYKCNGKMLEMATFSSLNAKPSSGRGRSVAPMQSLVLRLARACG